MRTIRVERITTNLPVEDIAEAKSFYTVSWDSRSRSSISVGSPASRHRRPVRTYNW